MNNAAIIAKQNITNVFSEKMQLTKPPVRLSNELYMIKIDDHLFELLKDGFDDAVVIAGTEYLALLLVRRLKNLSLLDKVVYIEYIKPSHEIALVFHENEVVFENYDSGSINKALRLLGVSNNREMDEFRTLGLDKYFI